FFISFLKSAGSVGIYPQSPSSVPKYPVSLISSKTCSKPISSDFFSRSNSRAPHEQGAFAILIISYPLKFARPNVWPTLYDHLGLCKKLNGMLSLAVQVAKKAVLPATERELGHWCGNTYVDPNISCISFIPEFSR